MSLSTMASRLAGLAWLRGLSRLQCCLVRAYEAVKSGISSRCLAQVSARLHAVKPCAELDMAVDVAALQG